jgi:hypothetical protein
MMYCRRTTGFTDSESQRPDGRSGFDLRYANIVCTLTQSAKTWLPTRCRYSCQILSDEQKVMMRDSCQAAKRLKVTSPRYNYLL